MFKTFYLGILLAANISLFADELPTFKVYMAWLFCAVGGMLRAFVGVVPETSIVK